MALHVWLSRAPAYGQRYNGGYRPKQGDKIEVFKQFVIDCYEKELFKGTTPFQSAAVPAAAPPPQQAAPVRAAQAAAQPTVDFFSDDFAAAPTPQLSSNFGQGFAPGVSIIAPSTTVSPPISGGGSDSPWSQKMKSADPFADFTSSASPKVSQNSAENDFFGGSSFVSSPATSSPVSFGAPVNTVDPFGAAFAAPAPVQTPPVAAASPDPFGSTVLFPVAQASAGAFPGSPLAAGAATGAMKPVQSYPHQQPIRPAMSANSGIAISSLMGYRGAAPAPGIVQKADSFDFVKDSMGINRSTSSSTSSAMSISGMGPSYAGAGAPMQPALNRNTTYPPAPPMMGGGMPGMYSAPAGGMMGQQPGWPNQQQYRR